MAYTGLVNISITESPMHSDSNNGVDPAVEAFRYFGISIAAFAIFVGTIGNLLTILAYFANSKLQTSFNILVVNLSVVDLITASLMLPFNLAGYVQMQWPFGNDSFTARIQAFSYFSCGYSSVVFLIAITFNRFIGVFWPTRYESLFKRQRMRIVLIFCWTFAPLLLLPFLIGSDPICNTPNNALTGWNAQQFLSTFICLTPVSWNIYMQFTRVLFQFLPLAIMIICYSAIFLQLRRKAKHLQQTMTRGLRSASSASAAVVTSSGKSILIRQISAQSNLGRAVNPKRKCSMAETKRAQNNNRMLIISVVICVAFMITFLPSVIVNLLPNRGDFDIRIHMTVSNVSWFNSALNPIIYVALNPRFRREYSRLLKILFGKTKAKFVHETSVGSVKNKQKTPQKNSLSNSIASNQQIIMQVQKQESLDTIVAEK